jgi:hypothetical protein
MQSAIRTALLTVIRNLSLYYYYSLVFLSSQTTYAGFVTHRDKCQSCKENISILIFLLYTYIYLCCLHLVEGGAQVGEYCLNGV